jgi:probable addiction module antidote protein
VGCRANFTVLQGALLRVEVSQNLAAAPCLVRSPKRNGARARLLTNCIQLDTFGHEHAHSVIRLFRWAEQVEGSEGQGADTAPAVASLPGHGEGIEGERAVKKAKAKARANVKAKVTYAPFEVADYLDSEEAIAEYLSLAARDENPGVLLKALGDVAKARGMAEVAKASGLGRESLYKTLAPGAKPRFETIATIMRALNVGFSVESRLAVRAKKARKLKAA